MEEKKNVYDYLIENPKGWLSDLDPYEEDLQELYDLGFLARGVSYFKNNSSPSSEIVVKDRYKLTPLGLKQCRLSSTLEDVEKSMDVIKSLMSS